MGANPARDAVYEQTLRYFFAPVAGLLYDDDTVTEVLINGPGEVYCERRGRVERVAGAAFADEHALEAAVRNLAEFVNRRVDERQPTMDARLPEPHKFRVNVVVPPISRSGICVSIRKFQRNTWNLDRLVTEGALSPATREYLEVMVRTHHNIMVSGGTGSGKTSLLNALSAAIPRHERVVVIEDSSELRLDERGHVVYLEARPAGPDGKGAVTIRDLFVNSLRMRPDRILVGEVRRGEALDLIQSMLSGHDGALSTVHASSPLLALVRLETLCLMTDTDIPVYVARTQVASALQVIAQVARFPDGSRRVREVSEVLGLDGQEKYQIRPIFHFVQSGVDADGRVRGRLEWTGKPSRFSRAVRELTRPEEIHETTAIWSSREESDMGKL
jgi:pilus assembly protein CpaF